MAKKKLAEAIRAKRGLPPYKKATLTLEEAGKQSGVPYQIINRIERGLAKPDPQNFIRLCSWLRVDPREVIL